MCVRSNAAQCRRHAADSCSRNAGFRRPYVPLLPLQDGIVVTGEMAKCRRVVMALGGGNSRRGIVSASRLSASATGYLDLWMTLSRPYKPPLGNCPPIANEPELRRDDIRWLPSRLDGRD
jgi:hypothetical protein